MKLRHLIVCFSTFCFGWNIPLLAMADDSRQQAKQLEQIKGEISQLSSRLDKDKRARKLLLEELARSEREIGRLGRFIHHLQTSIEGLDQELNTLAAEKTQQQQSLAVHKEKLRSLVLSAYATGRQERLKLFLNQQDPVLMNRVLTYYDFFNRERIKHIEKGNHLIAQIRLTEQQIAEKKQALDESYLEKNRQLEAMQQAKKTRAHLVAKLDSDIKGKSESLQQLKENAQNLQKLLADIQRQQQLKQQKRKQKFVALKGRLPWPSKGYLSKFFGSPKVGGVTWDGVLITAPEGREVKAIHHGRVAYSDWLRGYGLLMIIDHGDGYMTLYGHNQSLFKEVGEWVDAGEPIALVGNSGGQKNPGLYFSIRKAGKPTDPRKWCSRKKGRKL